MIVLVRVVAASTAPRRPNGTVAEVTVIGGAVVDRVERGELVMMTRDGRPVAEPRLLSPVSLSRPNVLVHGYATVDDFLVWRIVELSLPRLLDEIDALLADAVD